VPAVGFLASETGMPDEDLLLDGAKHDENQSHCGKLCKDTESYAQCSRHFRYSKKNGKALLVPILLLLSSNFVTWLQPLVMKARPTMSLRASKLKSANCVS
jgi:hypothetical protein